MENNLIERYIMQFEDALGNMKNRSDIVQELRSNIDEMLEPHATSDEAAVTAVLTELGNPVDLAFSYSNKPQALISGRFLRAYETVLKIVLSAVTLGMVISIMIEALSGVGAGQVVETTMSIFPAWLSAIGLVTIIFYFIERSGKGLETKAWTIEQLPQIHERSKLIPLSEPIASLIISTIFFVVALMAPFLFKFTVMIDGVPIHFFNFAAWPTLVPYFSLIYVASLVKNCVILLIRKYGKTVALTTIVSNLVQIFAAGFLILKAPFFDELAITTLGQRIGSEIGTSISIAQQKQFLFAIILVTSVIEMIVVTVKSFRKTRYKVEKVHLDLD